MGEHGCGAGGTCNMAMVNKSASIYNFPNIQYNLYKWFSSHHQIFLIIDLS
jgi:hypothetical protein